MKKKKTEIDEFDPETGYIKKDFLSKIPAWVAVIFLKYWAAAAVVFFLTIGGLDVGLDYSTMDTMTVAQVASQSMKIVIILALGMSLLFNYAIKQVVFMLHSRTSNVKILYLINMRGFLAFVLHFVYMLAVSLIMYFLITWLGYKGMIVNFFGNTNYGIEPFSYGFWFLIVDGIFVLLKDIIVLIVYRIQYNIQMKKPIPVINQEPVKEA